MKQKVILVTGGNRGIGLEICRQLLDRGHIVIMGTRDLNKGLQAAESISSKLFVKALDVTKENQIAQVIDFINTDFGRLDILINNAGILGSTRNFIDADLNEVKVVLETNVFGPWRLSQAMLPLLEKSKQGRIINVGSDKGELKNYSSEYSAYRISKIMLHRITLQMSMELKNRGIRVNAMCPGWVRTDMGGMNADRSVEEGADTAVWLSTTDSIPSGKFFRDRKMIDW